MRDRTYPSCFLVDRRVREWEALKAVWKPLMFLFCLCLPGWEAKTSLLWIRSPMCIRMWNWNQCLTFMPWSVTRTFFVFQTLNILPHYLQQSLQSCCPFESVSTVTYIFLNWTTRSEEIAALNSKIKNLVVKEIWHFENVKVNILQTLDVKLSRAVCESSFVTEEIKPNNFLIGL